MNNDVLQISKSLNPDKYIGATIIESGNNENGSWIKFSDGNLIQRGRSTFGTSGTDDDSFKLVTFPIPFISYDYSMTAQVYYTSQPDQQFTLGTLLTPSFQMKDSNYIYRRLAHLNPNDSGQYELYSKKLEFYWLAIGKWK